jgi:hypothetical protein
MNRVSVSCKSSFQLYIQRSTASIVKRHVSSIVPAIFSPSEHVAGQIHDSSLDYQFIQTTRPSSLSDLDRLSMYRVQHPHLPAPTCIPPPPLSHRGRIQLHSCHHQMHSTLPTSACTTKFRTNTSLPHAAHADFHDPVATVPSLPSPADRPPNYPLTNPLTQLPDSSNNQLYISLPPAFAYTSNSPYTLTSIPVALACPSNILQACVGIDPQTSEWRSRTHTYVGSSDVMCCVRLSFAKVLHTLMYLHGMV